MNSLQRKTIYGDHYYHLEFVIIRMTESIKHQEEFEPRIVDNMPNKSRQAHYYNKQDSYKMSIISDRFLSLYTVAITVHRLIRENASSTKRGLYYMHAGLFQDQKIVDSAADELAFILSVSRPDLRLHQAAKGEAQGHLNLPGCNFACEQGGQIPADLSEINFYGVQLPRFVLVLEKFAIYQRLVEEGFCASRNCLLVTGRGMPDRATRALLARLDQSRVPCYILVDGDPFWTFF